ncbi:MAG: hypothetical protein JWO31_2876 [Phycisphaerales bacterium]|nr:hypothetical protein [Phycisphaerales bacterium]
MSAVDARTPKATNAVRKAFPAFGMPGASAREASRRRGHATSLQKFVEAAAILPSASAADVPGARPCGGAGPRAESRASRRGLSPEDVRDLKETAGAAPELRALAATAEERGRAAA